MPPVPSHALSCKGSQLIVEVQAGDVAKPKVNKEKMDICLPQHAATKTNYCAFSVQTGGQPAGFLKGMLALG